MSGCWVFVCGPSGAGKDSVIAWARDRLAGHRGIVFAQRMATRNAPPGADHLELDPATFGCLHGGGALAWHWEANGLRYGIAGRYMQQVAWGRVVVVNGSREHVAKLAPRPGLRVVQVAAKTSVLAQRLADRGRDTPQQIAARMDRNSRFTADTADLIVGNEGALETAGRQLADFLAREAQLRIK